MLNPRAMQCYLQDYSQEDANNIKNAEHKTSNTNKSKIDTKKTTNILYKKVIKCIAKDINEEW